MTTTPPIGKHEDQGLEFKGAGALAEPAIIARAVVAMLNAAGGEIWIGIGEKAGRADVLDPIEDAINEGRRLQDQLLDVIEPSPIAAEVSVEPVPLEEEGGPAILRVTVKPHEERRPYAYLNKGGRHFVVRVNDRLRPMAREEIFRLHGSADRSRAERDECRRALIYRRDEKQRTARGYMWLYLLPAGEMELDLGSEDLESKLSDRSWTGDRPMGYRFHSGSNPRITSEGLILGSPSGKFTDVSSNGRVEFTVPLDAIRYEGRDQELNPGSLIELPASVMRLASSLYRGYSRTPAERLLADLAIFGAEGWRLRPGSLSDVWSHAEEPVPLDRTDLVSESPMVFSMDEFLKRTGHCAFRLIRRVYAGFGFGEKQMPPEFDRETGRFSLP